MTGELRRQESDTVGASTHAHDWTVPIGTAQSQQHTDHF